MNSMGNTMLDALMNVIGCDAPGPAEGDFIGDDGLLHCGKCRTKKQTRFRLPEQLGGAEKIVPCACQCEVKRREAEEAAAQRARDQERIARLRRKSLMDEMFRQSTFEHAKVDEYNQKPMHIARRYTERFSEMLEKNRGILFYGPPGTGKTYTAACIANALLDQGIPVMMTSFVKLNQIVTTSHSTDDDESVLDAMNRARLLIIDDLGAERDTDYSVERVYSFIDNRVRAKLPLILTTNLSLRQMQETTDLRYQRIYDRVFQVCYPVEVTGTSRRKREAAKLYREMTELLED